MSRAVDLLGELRARGFASARELLVCGAGDGLAIRTLEELEDRTSARLGELSAQGARAGRIHPFVAEPDLDGVLTLLGLWRLGATPAPLNPRLTDAERSAAVASLEGRWGEGAQVVLWTSGTSGRPRGVALGYPALAAHVAAASRHLGLEPERDGWLASLPLAHIGGFMVVFRGLLTGSRVVALGALNAERVAELLTQPLEIDAARRIAVSHASLVPTQLVRLLSAHPDRPPPPTLRCLLLGGAQTPRTLLDRALAAGWPVALTYGMTEMSSQVATALPDKVRRKPGTVGRPLPGVEVRVGPGGEVLVRGATMASGYLADEALRNDGGWYATGDLGALDEDGDLWITGRRSDRIISGGVNVDASEVEEALREHPAVADVCVVGVPDAEWGEVVGACVVPVAGEWDLDEVDGWLRGRLSAPKRPRKWRLEAALPLNASGKVDRARVRELLAGP